MLACTSFGSEEVHLFCTISLMR
uniref:Uncharacterized protein n=1 Tax=Arundo donax TaxID=35708 RepID=A0A0A8Z0L9_ARUDO